MAVPVKAFSATRATFQVPVVLGDEEVVVDVQSLSTDEFKEIGAMKGKNVFELEETAVRMMLKPTPQKTVDQVVKYICANSNIVDFSAHLQTVLEEVKKGK